MTNNNLWTIPDTFKQLPSNIDGITVFAPKPIQTDVHAPKTYKCPNCGASTKFDVSVAGISCEHCGYSAQATGKTVGHAAKQQEFTLATLALAEQGWGIERKNPTCENCGAVTSMPDNVLSTSCPFCASHRVNLSVAENETLRPKFLIPFQIPPRKTQELARNWLAKGWYHPAELESNSLIDKFIGIYLPFWTFDARVDASWRAQVGDEKTTRDKDGHTRTRIDWRWDSGKVNLHFDDKVRTATDKVSNHLLEKLLPYQLSALRTYSADFLAGWQALNFNIPLPDAWDEAKEEMRESVHRACRAQIDSPHVRNFSMTANFSDEEWRYILLPIYLAVYRHEDKVFQVMVNGQTGTVAGQKPVAWWKIWLAIGAMLLPGLTLGLISIPLFFLAGVGAIPFVLGFIALVFGGVGSVILYNKAVSSERA